MVDPAPTWTAAEADKYVHDIEHLEWDMTHMSLDATKLSPRHRKDWEDSSPRHREEANLRLRSVSKMLLLLSPTPPYKEHVQQCVTCSKGGRLCPDVEILYRATRPAPAAATTTTTATRADVKGQISAACWGQRHYVDAILAKCTAEEAEAKMAEIGIPPGLSQVNDERKMLKLVQELGLDVAALRVQGSEAKLDLYGYPNGLLLRTRRARRGCGNSSSTTGAPTSSAA